VVEFVESPLNYALDVKVLMTININENISLLCIIIRLRKNSGAGIRRGPAIRRTCGDSPDLSFNIFKFQCKLKWTCTAKMQVEMELHIKIAS
jgi:hypothetical protein